MDVYCTHSILYLLKPHIHLFCGGVSPQEFIKDFFLLKLNFKTKDRFVRFATGLVLA